MTATAHYITGVMIAGVVGQPLLAAPLSFASHFALDALPHFGGSEWKNRQRLFKRVWAADFICLMVAVVCTFIYASPWYFLIGFIATSPDLVWVYRFFWKEDRGNKSGPKLNTFNSFHAKIQKFEIPHLWALGIELAYIGLLLAIWGIRG
jgi:hypothetical protein